MAAGSPAVIIVTITPGQRKVREGGPGRWNTVRRSLRSIMSRGSFGGFGEESIKGKENRSLKTCKNFRHILRFKQSP